MSQPQQNHIAWIDYLRIAACFLVVIAHCCDPFVARFDSNEHEFLSGTAIGSMVRCCVPLFVMISGVLLLPVHMDTVSFYKRRLKRILIPLVVWSVLLPFMYYGYFQTGATSVSPALPAMETFTLDATWTKVYTFIFNFNYDTTPMWYLYMLVGIYLFIPFIGAWLRQAEQQEIKLFLKIWVVAMCLPIIQMVAPMLGYQGVGGNMGILGVCDWNPFGTFYYFSGFLGYVVLAHYLVRFPLNWSWGKTLAIALPLFAVGYAVTWLGFLLLQKQYPGNYARLEVIWYFAGINVFMMTFAVFVIFQKIRLRPSALVSRIAALTFGVYLCHFVFVQVCYDWIYAALPTYAFLKIPVIAVLSFALSLLVTWLLSLTKLTRKAIM